MRGASRVLGAWLAASAIASALACTGADEPAAPRLLLLVTVDTLRADALGAWGGEPGLTPRLDALAAEGVVFERAYAPASFTLPSVAALLTGRYPEELGIRSNESAVPGSAPALAAALAERGWRTRAAVGNFVLRRSSGVGLGFERFDDDFGAAEAVRGLPERRARATTDAALALLEGCVPPGPCFLWVHYQDPHGPYEPPAPLRARELAAGQQTPDAARELPVGDDHWGLGSIPAYQFLEGRRDVGFYRAGYRGEVAHVDAEVGRLWDAVVARGLAARTLLVFAADHGESLGEHDVWFSHGSRLTDEQVRVPLLLRGAGLAPARRSDVVSLVDVRPTLLALLSDEPATSTGPGRDLLAPGAEAGSGPAYFSTLASGDRLRYGLADEEFKLVLTERDGLFDARLYRIGREDVDLSAAAPHVVARLRDRLGDLRRHVATPVPETPQTLSARDREQLEALGYLEPAPQPR